MTRIIKQIFISYIPKIAIFASLPLILKILTNNLTVEEYGSYSLIYSLGNLLFFVAAFGVHRYLAKIIPGKRARSQYSNFISMAIFEIFIFIVFLLLVSLFIDPLSKVLHIGEYKIISLIFWWSAIFYLLFNETIRFFGLRKRLELKSTLSIIEKPFSLLLLFLLYLFGILNFHNIFISYIVVYIFLFLIGVLFLDIPRIKEVDYSKILANLKGKMFFIVPFFLVDLFLKTKDLLPRYFLSAFGNNELVGLFSFSDVFAKIFYLIANPFIFIMYPYIASNYNIRQKSIDKGSSMKPEFYRLSRISFNLSLFVYLSVAVVGFFFKEELIVLLSNKEYLIIGNTLIFFLSNYLLIMIIAFLQPIFILKYNMKKFIFYYLGFILINIILCWILTKNMFFGGALISMIGINLAFVIFLLVRLHKFVEKIFNTNDFFVIITYFLSIVFLLFVVKEILPIPFYLKAILASVSVLSLFYFFKKREIRFLFFGQF